MFIKGSRKIFLPQMVRYSLWQIVRSNRLRGTLCALAIAVGSDECPLVAFQLASVKYAMYVVLNITIPFWNEQNR